MQSQESHCSSLEDSISSNTPSAESNARDILISNPASWDGFRKLAALLESEGDASAAKECYLGRIPKHIQQRIFNENVDDLTVSGFTSKHSMAHESSSMSPTSPSINTTDRLNRYSDRKILSRTTGATTYANVNLWFDGYNTLVYNSAGNVDETTLIGNVAPALRAARLKEPCKLDGQVILIGGKGSNNYYHWMTDILPKFAVLEKAGISSSAQTKYVFTNVTSKFQIETLKHFGVNEDQLYTTNSQGQHIQAEELIIPVLTNTMGFTMGKWLPEYLKHRFNVEKSVSQFRKILVSRNAEVSHGRGIYNLAEFNQYFLDRGYETISPENYTVAEQATLFSEASHVVGPHGAGLTNLLFCQPGTNVYELYGEHLAPCYWAISELSGLHYLNLNCSDTNLDNASDLANAKSLGDRRSCSFGVNLSDLNEDYI